MYKTSVYTLVNDNI